MQRWLVSPLSTTHVKVGGKEVPIETTRDFARILGKYVRDEKVLRLEEAVRKMTSQPAARVHLQDRGILRPGMAADVTLFDPATIRDVATFEDPMHYAVGVRFVIVNGRAVAWDGRITDERPGRALEGPGAIPPSSRASAGRARPR